MFKRLTEKLKVIARWISIRTGRFIHFITHDIWLLDEDDFTRRKGRLVKDAKTILLMMNTFSDQKIGYQITALAFRSMLAVVPAIAIGLYLTDSLGMRELFEQVITLHLGDSDLQDNLLTAADNIVTTAHSSLFGFISMASFLWIVIYLMISVRRVFNNVWKVEKDGKVARMIGVVIGVTILAPFVVIIFFSGSVVYSNVLDFLFPDRFSATQHIKSLASWLMFAAVSVMVLAAMYKFIPATHVHSRCAFKAALVSGLVFTGVQYLYLETQMMVAKQSAVYGVLAALPLFMIWLNLGWKIVLYGAELSYAFQNVDQYSISEEKLDEMNEEAFRARRERFQKTMKI